MTIREGLLFKRGTKFVPTERNRGQVILEAHGLHIGLTRMKARLAEAFWWPQWWKDVENFANECLECRTTERTHKNFRPPCHPVALPRGPWEKIAIDIKGPMNNGGSRYLLVCMDYYSKWPDIISLSDISSDCVIPELEKIFGRLGFPNTIVSDNGTQFVSNKTAKFLKECGIRPALVPLYASNQNGLVERFNRVIGDKLKECERFGWNVGQTLERLLFDYRSTPQSTTRISPFEAMHGRKMRDRQTKLHPKIREVPAKEID